VGRWLPHAAGPGHHSRKAAWLANVLYVAVSTTRPAYRPGRPVESGTAVSAFDLADPGANPVARGSLWYAGWGNVVAATDVYFFVVTQPGDYYQSVVGVIDITAPDGTLRAFGSITNAGRIPDKFKLNYEGNVLTTIAESPGSAVWPAS